MKLFIVLAGFRRGLCCQPSRLAGWLAGSHWPGGLFVLCCVLFAPSPLGDNSHSAASSTMGHHPCLWKFISMAVCPPLWFTADCFTVFKSAPLDENERLVRISCCSCFELEYRLSDECVHLITSHQDVSFNLFFPLAALTNHCFWFSTYSVVKEFFFSLKALPLHVLWAIRKKGSTSLRQGNRLPFH